MTTSARLTGSTVAAVAILIALLILPRALAGLPLVPGVVLAALVAGALALVVRLHVPSWLPCWATTWLRSWLPIQYLLVMGVACEARLSGTWPCDIACQGGGSYQHLLGLPLMAVALIAILLLLLLAARDRLRGSCSPLFARLIYAGAGGSLFFSWISWQLGLACPFCRTIHLSMLLAAGCTPPPPGGAGAPSWRAGAAWMAAGFLLLNLAFHHQAMADVARMPVAGAPDGAEAPGDARQAALRNGEAYRQINAGRSLGPPDARFRVLVVVDPHCRSCAEEYAPLLAALTPLSAGATPRLAISTQFLVRASDASGPDLVAHLLATALLGERRFRAVLAVALGAPAGSAFSALAGRVAEVDDPAAITAAATTAHDAIVLVEHDDAARLAALSGRAVSPVTPQVLLVEQLPGSAPRLVRRWLDALDGEALAGEIAALTRP